MASAYRRAPRGVPKAKEEASVVDLPLKRNSKRAKALRASTLLDNPEVRSVFQAAREQMIADIERTQLDGSQASQDLVLERVRQLQALLEVQRIILRPIVQERMKAKQVDK